MLGCMYAPTVRHPQYDRAAHTATRAMPQPAHVVHDLIDRRIQKAHELNFRDGLHALGGKADTHAGDHILGERRVLYAVRPEAFEESGGSAKDTAALADILTEHEHARIVFELPRLRHRDGFDHCYF